MYAIPPASADSWIATSILSGATAVLEAFTAVRGDDGSIAVELRLSRSDATLNALRRQRGSLGRCEVHGSWRHCQFRMSQVRVLTVDEDGRVTLAVPEGGFVFPAMRLVWDAVAAVA
jgi:hypothetical protein